MKMKAAIISNRGDHENIAMYKTAVRQVNNIDPFTY
jgi:hypothetical protein